MKQSFNVKEPTSLLEPGGGVDDRFQNQQYKRLPVLAILIKLIIIFDNHLYYASHLSQCITPATFDRASCHVNNTLADLH